MAAAGLLFCISVPHFLKAQSMVSSASSCSSIYTAFSNLFFGAGVRLSCFPCNLPLSLGISYLQTISAKGLG